MINQYKLNKALSDKLRSVVGDEIALQGENYEPNPDESYFAEKEVPTSVTTPLGCGTDRQQGFYQVTVCTPINKMKFTHAQLVDSVMPAFSKGFSAGIEYDGQRVSIYKVTPSGMYSDSTHLKTALTINYTVIA